MSRDLLHDLKHSEEMRHQAVAPAASLDVHLILLRTWQSKRLTQTYADLLLDARYSAACNFFLNDLYAARDFSQRDHDMERIHKFLSGLFPPQMFKLLTTVIELNNLTNTLDKALLGVLVDQLSVTDTITPEVYAEGYRLCNNYRERMHQIDLILEIVRQLTVIRTPIVDLALNLVRGPARQAGWDELYDFVARGYKAFKRIGDPEFFVGTVEKREKHILDQIYSGNADPFTI